MLEGHAAVRRHGTDAVDDAQQAADGRGLVVTVEAQGAADIEGLLDISAAIQQGENAHGAVQVGIPDGLRGVRLLEIQLVGNDLARRLPVFGILLVQGDALVHNGPETILRGQVFLCMGDEGGNVGLEESLRIHDPIDDRRRRGPVVGGDAGRPVGNPGRIGRHARSRIGPDFVNQLRVNLEPMRIVAFVSGERRGQPVMHQAQGGPVGQPYAVADVVHPAFLHLRIGRVGAIFLHHHQIEIFHIGVVVGEGAIDGRHLAHGLVPDEGSFARFFHELVFVFQAVYIADHLANPGSGNLVFELCAGNLLIPAAARDGEQQEHSL